MDWFQKDGGASEVGAGPPTPRDPMPAGGVRGPSRATNLLPKTRSAIAQPGTAAARSVPYGVRPVHPGRPARDTLMTGECTRVATGLFGIRCFFPGGAGSGIAAGPRAVDTRLVCRSVEA